MMGEPVLIPNSVVDMQIIPAEGQGNSDAEDSKNGRSKRAARKRSSQLAESSDPDFSSGESSPPSTKKSKSNRGRAKPKTVKPRPRSKALVSSGWDSMTYAEMIRQAILSASDQKMLLCDIYAYLEKNFDCFSKHGDSWKNSVRHNLSIHKQFKVVPIDSEREAQLLLEGKIKKGSAGLWTVVDLPESADGNKGSVKRISASTATPSTTAPSSPLHSGGIDTKSTQSTASSPSSAGKKRQSPLLEVANDAAQSEKGREGGASASPPLAKMKRNGKERDEEEEEEEQQQQVGEAEGEGSEDETEGSQPESDGSAESETANILLHLSK